MGITLLVADEFLTFIFQPIPARELPFKVAHNRLRHLSAIFFLSFIGFASFIGISRAQPPFSQSNPSGIEEIKRPKWEFFRFREDWSVLKDSKKLQKTDSWDKIKYIPINSVPDYWISFGGHMRLRYENFSNFNFGNTSGLEDDGYFLWRLLLHSDFHFGDNVRFFVEGKSALATDRDLPGGIRTSDVDSAALQQAFLDVKVPLRSHRETLTLRVGRQMLKFGKERLVSPLPWANVLRAWDGFTVILQAGGWTVDGFYTQFVPVKKFDHNETDAGNEFFGTYGTSRIAGIGIDLYWLGHQRDGPQTFNGTSGKESRHTLGGRLEGKILMFPVDYDLEGAYQFGNLGSNDINAFMVATQIGYRARGWGWKPRIFLGFDYASGDDSPGGDVETFSQLFPLGHAHLGYIDAIGRQNIIDFSQGISIHPLNQLTVNLHNHLFWRASSADALYNAGGNVSRTGALGASRKVGDEVDLTFKYKFSRHLVGLLGYSHFFAGEFIGESGANDDIDFFYTQFKYTF